jgi:hypothetical protein
LLTGRKPEAVVAQSRRPRIQAGFERSPALVLFFGATQEGQFLVESNGGGTPDVINDDFGKAELGMTEVGQSDHLTTEDTQHHG